MDEILYYDDENNIFLDACGFIERNVFTIVSPNVVYLFKLKKKTMAYNGGNGKLVMLFWPGDYEI